jgi:hypothetical protein
VLDAGFWLGFALVHAATLLLNHFHYEDLGERRLASGAVGYLNGATNSPPPPLHAVPVRQRSR